MGKMRCGSGLHCKHCCGGDGKVSPDAASQHADDFAFGGLCDITSYSEMVMGDPRMPTIAAPHADAGGARTYCHCTGRGACRPYGPRLNAATWCYKCPTGTSSPAGSTGILSCTVRAGYFGTVTDQHGAPGAASVQACPLHSTGPPNATVLHQGRECRRLHIFALLTAM